MGRDREPRHSHSDENDSRSRHVGSSPRRKRRLKVPFIAVGIVAIVAIICLAVSGAFGTFHQASLKSDELLTVNGTEENSTSITLSFAGDCTLGTDIYFNQSTSFNAVYDSVDDPAYFMANVADIFNNDDYTVVNFEGVLTDLDTRADKTYAFKGPASYTEILTSGGIEAVSLANNHSHDYGEQSYYDTIDALDEAEIINFGYSDIAYAC